MDDGLHKRIKLLSPILANQIAAGEVIERPASIVKELVENSIDAGATHLTIHLERGGKNLIKVQDNGIGIHPDDLTLSLSRHATSKIDSQADLAQIQTLGFRGEALASMASIAKLTLTSQHANHEAQSASASGRDMAITVKPASHPRGTTVEVKDLFFNTPARKKFLKSERTEFLHVEEVVKHLALGCHDVSIDFYHDKKLVKRYVAANASPQTRIQAVLSKTFIDASVSIDHAITQARLQGWIGKPEFARSSNDYQFFYVNGRMVRDKVMNHAVRLAYENKIYPGRFPAYVLYLTCDPAGVDVNVHPTKHEVRFRESRLIHDFVAQSVEAGLNDGLLRPCRPRNDETFSISSLRAPQERSNPLVIPSFTSHPFGTVLTLLDNKVLITQQDNILFAIDWLKTLTHYVQKNWQQCLNEQIIPLTPLLLPITLDEQRYGVYTDKLSELGFELQTMGPSQILLRAIPRPLQGIDIQKALNDLLEQKPVDIKQYFAKQWAQSQSTSLRDINTLLADCAGLLGKENIPHKFYVSEMLI